MRGQANSSNFERTIFEPGQYTMTLTKALCMWGKPTQFQPEGAAKIMFVWKYEVDDQEYELVDYLGFPKNMKYNDKSNFWKRVGEIAGITIASENADLVDVDFGDFIQSYAELCDHLQSTNAQGNTEKAEVKSVTVGDQELLGKRCQLVVKVWEKDGKSGNEIAAVLQLGGGTGPRKPQKAAPAAAATRPAPQAALVSAGAPAPRANTTEPAHAGPRPASRAAAPQALNQAETDLPF
ncbi:hypothetical protein Q0M94_03565 [Deinococcus radiomollis]|uniref:hypothetical protein n=1 Tax=Deinococcus radiomollis TaxID=468916 RepID=UPI0038919FA4